jgi:predicted outer membrane repeat protein
MGLAGSDPNVRNVELYRTTLSGDLGGDDDPNGWADSIENSVNVLTGDRVDKTAVISGFIITGGFTSNVGPGGGGMVNNRSDATIIDCVFHRNCVSSSAKWPGYGAAMHNDNSSPTLIDCTFSDNHGLSGGMGTPGGGMLNYRSSPVLNNCTFIGNQASDGGVMHNWDDSNPRLIDCRFIGNSATWSGGGIDNCCTSSPTLVNCTFSGNSARHGGAISNSSSCETTLINCVFNDNSATQGGGIRNTGKMELESCVFLGNSAEGGGGFYNKSGNPRLTRCTFTANRASQEGGAFVDIGHEESTELNWCLFAGNTADYGGAIYVDEQSSIVTNCTFSGNIAMWEGGAIYCWDASLMTLANCILWDNSPAEVGKSPYSTTPEVYFSDVKGGWTGRGSSNVSVNPAFADPGYWDPNGTPDDKTDDFWVDGDYHLKSGGGTWDPEVGEWIASDVTSGCIDAGDPITPIGHEPFPNGGVVNMGAFGGTAEASKSYFRQPACETVVAGDLNGDCRVDFKDMAILLMHWLQDYAD